LRFSSGLTQATNFRLVQFSAQGTTSAARYRRLQPVSILPRPGISLSQCFGLISSRSCRFRPAYIRKPPLQGVTRASRGLQAPSTESTGLHSISSRWHRPRERHCMRSGTKIHEEDRSSTPRTGPPLVARARTPSRPPAHAMCRLSAPDDLRFFPRQSDLMRPCKMETETVMYGIVYTHFPLPPRGARSTSDRQGTQATSQH